jgi:hypothetical protein
MRLTRKNEIYLGGYEPMCEFNEAFSKLGKLEDIEEALGVDLILYLKMCVIGTNVCVKYQDEIVEMKIIHKIVYNPDLKMFGFFAPPDYSFIPRFPMSEYGRTWALSKDELNK